MKYVCLGFFDENKFAQLPQAEAQKMMDECIAYDEELRRNGHYLGGEALDSYRNAVTLRTKNGEVEVTDGPYVETKETLGGILLLEARDLNHAIALMSKHPGVKMGPFEIRPSNEAINQLIAERIISLSKTT
ncbi:MAG: YciI family protein [Planctomycetaceae bacterium]